MIASAGGNGGLGRTEAPVSKVATAGLFAAWPAIALVVIGSLIDSRLSLSVAIAWGLAGVAIALVAFAVVRRSRGRVKGGVRAFRALILSMTAIGIAAPKVHHLDRLERDRRDAEAARQLFHAVEKRIEEADSVSVRGRCDAFDQVVHFTILLGKSNRVFVRMTQLARDESTFTKELICDGNVFQLLENGVSVHEGPAPRTLGAHLRMALLRLQLQDGSFLGRDHRPFRASMADEREFGFPLDLREKFPASMFRFVEKPEAAPFPNGVIEFSLQAGPESRRETLGIDRNSGLPWKRTSVYRVGAAGWGRETHYDEFSLNGGIDLYRFVRRGPTRE